MTRKEFMKSALAAGGLGVVAPSGWSQSQPSPSDQEAKVVRATEGKTLNVIGDQQTIKLTGEDTNGQFVLIEEENQPGMMIPMHVHDHEDEVFRVLEGQVALTVGDQTTVLEAGDLAFGPRGIPHSWKIVGEQKARVILSVFPAGIEFMFEELAQLPAGPPDPDKVAQVCRRYGIRFIS